MKSVRVLSERDGRLRNRVSRSFEIDHSLELDRVVFEVVQMSESMTGGSTVMMEGE